MRLGIILIFSAFFIAGGYSQEIKKEYYENGSVKIEYTEVNGNPDGLVKLYYESGELQGKLNFSNGKQNGASLIYYKSGALMKQISYLDGRQVDTMKIFYESGPLQEISIVKNGKKEGNYVSYYENGNLRMKGFMKEGKLHSYCEHYGEDGKLTKEGEYYYGKPVGTWKEYNGIGVTQKQYEEAPKDGPVKTGKILTLKSDDFQLSYPDSWTLYPAKNQAVKFLAFLPTTEDHFKENLTIVIQPINNNYKNLDEFTDYANAALQKSFKNYAIVSDLKGKNKNYEYRDIVYTMVTEQGNSSLPLKFWTRYFIIKKITYQITLASEEACYEELIT
ncbi:MAG: toxin-antitoxin system YwqK family antitoxin, partial [Cytophagaceae bacterium]